MNKNSFLVELSESERTMVGKVQFADQPLEQQVFSSIWELEGQVNNGGFAQLFSSAEGHVASFAPRALRMIEAHKCADIVTRALRVIADLDLPPDQETREKMVQELDEKALDSLEQLDQEFLAYPDDLTEHLFDYVKARPQVFGAVAEE